MNLPRRQHGLTMISLVFVVAVVIFLAMGAIKLFPVYMENFSVQSVVNGLADDPDAQGKSPTELRKMIDARFTINDVKRVKGSDFEIKRDGNAYKVSIDYEERVPFIANIDFVVSFSDSVEVPTR